MEWFVFALIAPILWAVNNVVDKILLTKKFKNPFTYQIWTAIFDGLAAILLLIFLPISFSYPGFLLGIIIGIINVVSLLVYNKAMLVEEASRVVPMSYLDALFVLPMSYIFFGEVLDSHRYFGILLLIAGAMLISYKSRIKGKYIFSPAIKMVLIIAVAWAYLAILEKYALGFIDPLSLMIWIFVGFLIGAPCSFILPKTRKNFSTIIKKIDRSVFMLTVIGLIFAYIAFSSFLIALSLGSPSLVVGVATIQPLITFFYTTTLSRFAPKYIKEEIDKRTIFFKLISICLIFIGVWLITV
jgi:transporter family protein